MATVRGLVHGRWRAQALAAVLRLGIPEALRDGPLTVADLAAATRSDSGALRRLLDLLATLEVCARCGDRYGLAKGAERLLDDHPQTVARDARYSLSPEVAGAWAALPEAVRGAGPPPREPTAAPAYRDGVAAGNAAALAAAGALGGAGHVLVAGRQNAAFLAALLAACPGLTGELGGLAGPFPAAAYYVLPHVLHDLADESTAALLGAVSAAMDSASVLIILAAAKQETGSHLLAAYLDVRQFLGTAGRERTEREHELLLRQAGLRLESGLAAPGRPGICLLTARRG
jgi:hypothetical protein